MPRFIALIVSTALLSSASAVMSGDIFVPGRMYTVKLDGIPVGVAKKIAGGISQEDIAAHDPSPDNTQKKHLATISHEPLTLELGMSLGKPMYDWIQASFDSGLEEKELTLIGVDFDQEIKSVRTFYDAHITSVKFPSLDIDNEEPGYLILDIDAQSARYGEEQLSGDEEPVGEENVGSKKWLASNFRFELGDLPCDRVHKIDSFSWNQGVIKDEVGKFRSPSKHASALEIPNLKITFSAADITPWRDWFKRYIVDGEANEDEEKTGQLTFLGPDMTEELGTIDFIHVGIISLDQEATEANKEEIARFEVELYVETITFTGLE